MNNKKWLVFSFSLPVKNQGFRVKIWRKLNMLGAVQVKNSLYLLPAGEHHQEQLTWMAKETEEQGGEAIIIANGDLLNVSDAHIRGAFTRARDEDLRNLEEEIRAFLELSANRNCLSQSSMRKFSRRLEAIRAIDFFPSGKGLALHRLLDEAGRLSGDLPTSVPLRDPAAYRGKIWVTRANPYVDRLASIWLIRRFIDPQAKILFLRSDEPYSAQPQEVTFDMAAAEFTHLGGRITLEVITEAFSLSSLVPARMLQVLKAIDLEEMETAPDEAAGVKRMLDGLVASTPDDQARIEPGLAFFDTLRASYPVNKEDSRS